MSLDRIAKYLIEVRRVSVADLLRVYDPTLDPDARPLFMDDDSEFEPFESPVDPISVSKTQPIIVEWGETEADTVKVKPQHVRVKLDGRVVRHAFEASSKGGWVRFLAPGSDGLPYSYKSATHQSKWGRVEDDESGGAVTGLAFGKVEWLVRKGIVPAHA